MESVLNINCSALLNAKHNEIKNVNLLIWLKSDKYYHQQLKVRAAKNDDEKRIAKEAIPCITPSGTFSKRGKNYLIKHTCLIAIDIDFKDNLHILNYENLKSEICKIQNVAYCGVSVSGNGYWLLIPIAYPEKHELHFEFLAQYFKTKNINIDKACKDVCRLRFYSYDPQAYFNHSAKLLQAHFKPINLVATKTPYRQYSAIGEPVWKCYNESKSFIQVLENHGWKIDRETGNKKYFTRPNKASGISAEYDSTKNVFYVFSNNGAPFESNTGYNPFQVFTILEHSGNFKKAIKALLKKDN